jgi:hypothetical protein
MHMNKTKSPRRIHTCIMWQLANCTEQWN